MFFYQAWIKNLGFAQRRLVGMVQGIVVRGVTPLDANWRPSALSLAQIRLEAVRCFEGPDHGPQW